jgi:uncharacterized membrane protein
VPALEASITALELLAALGCSVVGGVFFGFSTFVMKALARLPAAVGIAAMQAINAAVLTASFLGVFLGTAVACAVAVVIALFDLQATESEFLLLGGVLYLVGTLLVTIVGNVPRNDALAGLSPTASDAPAVWAGYISSWTFWNHVRAGAAILAAAAFMLALAS